MIKYCMIQIYFYFERYFIFLRLSYLKPKYFSIFILYINTFFTRIYRIVLISDFIQLDNVVQSVLKYELFWERLFSLYLDSL